MNIARQMQTQLSQKLNEIEAIVEEYGYKVTPTLLLRHDQGPDFSILIGNDDLNKVVLCIAEMGNIGEVVEEELDKEEKKPLNKREKWINVLTDDQKAIRKQARYDEINLTDKQKEMLGEEGCCWIESPSFYSQSKWCG